MTMRPPNLAEAAGVPPLDLETLISPVPGDAPAGISLRYDALYPAVRAARHQDDATLPMGEWERPLAKADWGRVAALCSEALVGRSKDFQLAAWLCEAWTHMHGVAGFVAGTRALNALAQHYWDDGHPAIEHGDSDARCAPFAWLNETLPLVLALHVPLLVLPDLDVPTVSLERWERTATGGEEGLSRDSLVRRAGEGRNQAALVAMRRQLDAAMQGWHEFDLAIDARLGGEAPSLRRVPEALQRLQRAVATLLQGYDEVLQEQAPDPGASAVMDAAAEIATEVSMNEWQEPIRAAAQPLVTAPVAGAGLAPGQPANGIANRTHAYRLLEEIADFLAQNEPHSPTPYLLRRAVSWGQMPLAELMRDILREDGDVHRYLALLEQQ